MDVTVDNGEEVTHRLGLCSKCLTMKNLRIGSLTCARCSPGQDPFSSFLDDQSERIVEHFGRTET